MPAVYKKMGDALKATGRPIVYSFANMDWTKFGSGARLPAATYGAPPAISRTYGRAWRPLASTRRRAWSSTRDRGIGTIRTCSKSATAEYGCGRVQDAHEPVVHASCAAIGGNDLSQMTPYTVELLTNPEVIAVDQDPLGKQGYRIAQEGPFEIWMKPMADGSKVVGLFNRQRNTEQMTVNFAEIGITGGATVRDLWLRKDLGTFTDKFTAYVPMHGVVLVRIKSR